MSSRLELLRQQSGAERPGDQILGDEPNNLTLLAQFERPQSARATVAQLKDLANADQRAEIQFAAFAKQGSGKRLQTVSDERAAQDKPADKPQEPTVRALHYDDGRDLEFTVNPQGQLIKLVVNGRTYTRRGDSDVWDYRTQTQVGQWFGEMRFNEDGSYTTTPRGSQESTTRKTTGAVELSYPDGSAVESLKERVLSVRYPDNKRCQFKRDDVGNLTQMKEADGTTWTAGADGTWRNDGNNEQRTDLRVAQDGTVSFTDGSRTRHSIDRSAKHQRTFADTATIETVGDQVKRVRRANGQTVDCQYKDSKLTKVTISGSTSYTLKDGGADEWTYKHGNTTETWRGTIQVTADGATIYTTQQHGATVIDTYSLDGKRAQRQSSGATVEFDADKRPSVVTRPGGSRLECEYANGKLTKITEVSKTGVKNTWQKDSTEERWYCRDFIGSQRMNLGVDDFGRLTYESVGGTKYATDASAIHHRERPDGTRVQCDREGRAELVTLSDNTTLTCGYTDGKLSSLVAKKAGVTTNWTRNGQEWTAPEQPGLAMRDVSVNADGEYAFIASRDNQVTTVRYLDGTSREFKREGDKLTEVIENTRTGTVSWKRQGDTDQWTSGTRTETRTDLDIRSNGTYSFVRDGRRQAYAFDGTEDVELPGRLQATDAVETEGKKLWEVIAKEFAEPADRTAFQRDMESFHRRATLHQVPDAQIARTFEEIRLLIQADDKTSTIKKEARLNLAKEILHHLAVPRAIDQGWHETCNVATVQIVTATKQPDKFAALVRQVATTGRFRTTTNVEVSLDGESLKPDWQARYYRPYDPARNTYARSYASQLFQVAAINSYYATNTSNRRYEQRVPADPKDTGERLVDTSTGAVVAKVPNLTCDNMIEVGRQIGSPVTILETSAIAGGRQTKFSTEQQLSDHLQSLQKNRGFPAIIMVHTGNEPYWSENGAGRSGRSGGWHVVTIWDVDAAGRVLVDNQWGRRADHENFRRMTVNQLYRAAQMK